MCTTAPRTGLYTVYQSSGDAQTHTSMKWQPLAPGEVSSGSPSLTMTMSRASRARSCSMTDAILRYVPLSRVAICGVQKERDLSFKCLSSPAGYDRMRAAYHLTKP